MMLDIRPFILLGLVLLLSYTAYTRGVERGVVEGAAAKSCMQKKLICDCTGGSVETPTDDANRFFDSYE